VEGSDTVVVLKLSQAAAMNTRFVKLKKDIDSVSVDYRRMKFVADSIAAENICAIERLHDAELKPMVAVNKVNDQWRTGVSVSVWLSVAVYFIFQN
tara:strand:+ start:139 stop:426 length:288 start_codon:yes stop_codon:yes gene_type:complete